MLQKGMFLQTVFVALAITASATGYPLSVYPAATGKAGSGISGRQDNTVEVKDSIGNDSTDTVKRQQDLIDSLMANQTLDDVVVVSQRQLVKVDADKLTYDIQADEESKTKTVMDMLRKVPLVSVDGEDNIKVKGSSDFKIYKNGHPDPSLSSNAKDILKSIPASSVKKIEVITEPGAKYDAEGVTAILNIVMADGNRLGGITGTLQGSLDTRGTQLGGNMTAQAGKFIVSANYGYYHQNERFSKHHGTEETIYGDTGNKMLMLQSNKQPADVHFLNIDTSFELDSLNLFTLSGGGYAFNVDLLGESSTQMTTADGLPIYKYNGTFKIPGYAYHNWNGRFDYQHKTHLDGEVFTMSYMFSLTKNKDKETFEYEDIQNMPMSYDGYSQDKREWFYEHTFQADWVRPLAEHHKLETGLKYIYRLNKSNTTMLYDGDGAEDVYSRFEHTTQVAAAYAQYLLNVGKWSARAGLRYEFSRMQAEFPDGSNDAFHRNLNDWVPSASVQYRISDANSIKLSYATTINRPGIGYLNPAVISSPVSVNFGNSALTSARKTMLGLAYMHTGAKLTFSLNPFYNFVNDNITEISYLKDGKKYSTYGNVLRYRTYGVSGYVQCQPWKGATVMVNGDVTHEAFKNPHAGMSNAAWYGNLHTNISQKLPWKLSMSLGGGGQIGHDASNVYGYGSTWYYSYFGLQRPFLKDDRLTVRLNANNPIGGKYQCYRSGTTQGDFTGISNWWSRQKSVSVSVSLRLGKLSATVKKTDKTIENEDVVGGIQKK